MHRLSIGIIGAGSFGTALASIWSQKGHRVTLWARDVQIVSGINTSQKNPCYLSNLNLKNILATEDLSSAMEDKDIVVFTIPTQFLRAVLKKGSACSIHEKTLFVNTCKGIEQETLVTPSVIFEEIFGLHIKKRFAVLSGPTFSEELVAGQPTGAVIASSNPGVAKQLQEILSARTFRLYTGDDVLGTELGGALKNVMAIGTGIAEGLGFGLNTRAGLMTRCLAEMTRLGVKMGADPLTFSGLSGLGDLILTCTGDLSRNRKTGLLLGRGQKLPDIIRDMKCVVEGVATAKSAYLLAKKHAVDMPNTKHIYLILYENLPPSEALKGILSRALKDEMEGIE